MKKLNLIKLIIVFLAFLFLIHVACTMILSVALSEMSIHENLRNIGTKLFAIPNITPPLDVARKVVLEWPTILVSVLGSSFVSIKYFNYKKEG
ncbi:hypothetical protein P7D73_18080 [Enterococcus raffinosus]|uniref:hypothetical protein n=1 Tax=Enterococcus raffinosus TaxID=71452 RepID=UPI00289291F5|nr:hypothetical protein [Enterococcus raffinosus]MDT2525115.1 hypothetical protein [Enterococcus raffinosus]MDT2592470.1 hypothetical protein [Enterococcus raffinosus]